MSAPLITEAASSGPSEYLLTKTAIDIREENPRIDESLLIEDRKAIEKSYPQIYKKFVTGGFSSSDVDMAISASWKDMRTKESDGTPITPVRFIETTAKYGKLRIESLPPKAEILINDSLQDETTDATRWLAPKRYRIMLRKDGYVSAVEIVQIKEGENPPIRKRLQRR